MSFLNGKKTYIVGVLMVLLGLFNDFDYQMILNGLAIVSGRAAIAKIK